MKLSIVLAVGLMAACPSDVWAAKANWDGTWNGSLGREKPWPLTIVVAEGKVVRFIERGVAFDVRFSRTTPNGLVFGDGSNYQVELNRSGDDAATAKVHGRLGTGPARLTRS